MNQFAVVSCFHFVSVWIVLDGLCEAGIIDLLETGILEQFQSVAQIEILVSARPHVFVVAADSVKLFLETSDAAARAIVAF